jgi:hypothetical protein
MAHFAKLDENNIVTFVTVGRNEDNELELSARTGDTYKQTSYNTHGGIYYQTDNTPSPDQSKAFRKNFAGVGYTYDKDRDAFIPPQPYPSWTLNEQTCNWDSPIPYPNDGSIYSWNEGTQVWDKVR